MKSNISVLCNFVVFLEFSFAIWYVAHLGIGMLGNELRSLVGGPVIHRFQVGFLSLHGQLHYKYKQKPSSLRC